MYPARDDVAHSMNAKPAKKPIAINPRPYMLPKLSASEPAPLLLPLLPAVEVAAAPPKPVYTIEPELAAASLVAVADMVDEVVVFTRFGS